MTKTKRSGNWRSIVSLNRGSLKTREIFISDALWKLYSILTVMRNTMCTIVSQKPRGNAGEHVSDY